MSVLPCRRSDWVRRLTNASPFIEDDTQRDIRTRVAERTVDWSCLASANVSSFGTFWWL